MNSTEHGRRRWPPPDDVESCEAFDGVKWRTVDQASPGKWFDVGWIPTECWFPPPECWRPIEGAEPEHVPEDGTARHPYHLGSRPEAQIMSDALGHAIRVKYPSGVAEVVEPSDAAIEDHAARVRAQLYGEKRSRVDEQLAELQTELQGLPTAGAATDYDVWCVTAIQTSLGEIARVFRVREAVGGHPAGLSEAAAQGETVDPAEAFEGPHEGRPSRAVNRESR